MSWWRKTNAAGRWRKRRNAAQPSEPNCNASAWRRGCREGCRLARERRVVHCPQPVRVDHDVLARLRRIARVYKLVVLILGDGQVVAVCEHGRQVGRERNAEIGRAAWREK